MNLPHVPIEFLTDGRLYTPTGWQAGRFVVAFGRLLKGPAVAPVGSLVVEFSAELRRPDGSRLRVAEAHVDYPSRDESPGEGPFVLLRGAQAADVPSGTLIVSVAATS
jgi:hypothetical protein